MDVKVIPVIEIPTKCGYFANHVKYPHENGWVACGWLCKTRGPIKMNMIYDGEVPEKEVADILSEKVYCCHLVNLLVD